MARFLVFVILILVLYYILYYLIRDMSSRYKNSRRGNDPEELVQDPYCQTYIPQRSALKKRFAGKEYYFCSQSCLEAFRRKEK